MTRRGAAAARLAARPPAVAGLASPTCRDALRLVWWAQRGFLHGARRGGVVARVFSAFMAVTWWPCVPVLLVGQWWALQHRTARYYLSPRRDAVLAVVARGDGWHVQEHYSSAPGTGKGRALRQALLPTLLATADQDAVTIHATAATRALARQYAAQLPGFVDVGRGFYRGRRLQRLPSPR